MIRHTTVGRAFIGRSSELAELENARRSLAQSRGSLLLLGGEAGIGKTRLLAEFLARSKGGRARNIASAECLQHASHPFGPIRSLVRALLPIASRDFFLTTSGRALGQVVPEAASRVDAARGVPVEKALLFAALADFFKCVAAKRATVLSIEDLHWADPSTLEFLEYFAPRITAARLMLICTYRSEEVESRAALLNLLAGVLRERSVRSITLQPLSSGDIRAILQDALHSRARLAVPTIGEIERRCEGNPFFAEELLKDAIDQPGAEGVSLPLSIRASIVQRLALLSDDARRILSYAAVLGDRFDPSLIALVMQRDVESVLPALHRARGLNFIFEEHGPLATCRFRHALTREAIYDEMLAFDSRRVHERIIELFETLNDDDRYLQELAYHAWQAKDAAKTVEYNERAGEAALGLSATADAAECFQRALSAVTDEGDEVRLLERLGSAAEMQGRLSDAIERFESALAIRLRRSEFDAAGRIVPWIVGDRSNMGDNTAVPYAEDFLARYGDRLSAARRDNILALAARLTSAVYDFAAVDRFLSGMSEPRSLEPRGRQNELIARLNLQAYKGDTASWERVVLEFDEVLPSLSPYLSVIALLTIAQSGTYLGVNEIVRKAFDRAERLQRKWAFNALAVFGAAVKSAHLYLIGEIAAARSSILRALEGPDVPVARQVLAQVGALVGLALNDDTIARRCLDENVIRQAQAETISVDTALILAARGTWLAERGRLHESRADLRLALDGLREATPACGIVLASAGRYLGDEELPRVVKLAESAGQSDNLVVQANAALVAAIVARRSGGQATEAALSAAGLFRRLGWPMHEAQALEIAGQPEAAAKLYDRCGATADVHRLSGQGAPADSAAAGPALSSRERQIAQLVTLGLTNTAIAQRLAVRTKTVEKHLSSIFDKLAVRSRAQIAAYVAREEAGKPTPAARG